MVRSVLARTPTDGSDAHDVGVFRRAVWFVIVIKNQILTTYVWNYSLRQLIEGGSEVESERIKQN